MVGTIDYGKIVNIVTESQAKLITVGDDNQLQAIQAGGANRLVKEHSTSFTLDEIRRQVSVDDQKATYNLSTGEQRNALEYYQEKEAINWHSNKEEMLKEMTEGYLGIQDDEKTGIIMAHRRVDVAEINESVHNTLKERGELEKGVVIDGKEFSEGERFIFLRNDNALEVKNGTTGTLERMLADGEMQVKTDDGCDINFNVNTYKELDRAYAVTIHKAQGVSVDEAQVYLDAGVNSHLALVGCTRHKEDLQIHVMHQSEQASKGLKDFDHLVSCCEKSQAKTLVSDYQEILKGHVTGLDEVNKLIHAELCKDASELARVAKNEIAFEKEIAGKEREMQERDRQIKGMELGSNEQRISPKNEKELEIGGIER